jgi:predicted phage baseplate assembly protein
MARGRIEPPNLDDRSWQDIVDECKALIPRYAPEWTDHNTSDLGITLVELFAWLVEGMIYRLNRVPDKNFIEFLNLLGITRDPATPASVFLTYSAAAAATVPVGSQAATIQSSDEPPVIFETTAALEVLPTNLTTALYSRKVLLDKYLNISRRVIAAPLEGFSVLVPGTPGNNDATLFIGFDQPVAAPIRLLVRVSSAPTPGPVQLQLRYSRGTAAPGTWPILGGVSDGTSALSSNGAITFTVPLDWASQVPATHWPLFVPDSLADVVSAPQYWIALRLINPSTPDVQVPVESILFNSVESTNAITVPSPGEVLGASTGAPFQRFALRNTPVYKRPAAKDPYDHLILQVRPPLVGGGFGPWVTWRRVEYFTAGAAEEYRLDPVTGTVSFGNHDAATPAGQGSVPPAGSEIRAQTYRYAAGGSRGNVGSGTVMVMRTPPPPGIIGVKNIPGARGGSDEESIEETKRRAPEVLRNRNRAITADDYEYLAREATTDVRKVRCLAPRLWTLYDPAGSPVGDPWTFGQLNRDTGNVNVVIVPDAPLTDRTPPAPVELIREVSDYLMDRRVVTANLHVAGPRYLPIRATVAINVWRKAADSGLVPDPAVSNAYRDQIVARIMRFFHPVKGGADGKGWEVGQDATISELFEFIRPDSEIGFISALSIQGMTPLYTPTTRPFPLGTPGVWVQLADYEIVCSDATHVVTVTKV